MVFLYKINIGNITVIDLIDKLNTNKRKWLNNAAWKYNPHCGSLFMNN